MMTGLKGGTMATITTTTTTNETTTTTNSTTTTHTTTNDHGETLLPTTVTQPHHLATPFHQYHHHHPANGATLSPEPSHVSNLTEPSSLSPNHHPSTPLVGLAHISQLSHDRTVRLELPSDAVAIGDDVHAVVLESYRDERSGLPRISLSVAGCVQQDSAAVGAGGGGEWIVRDDGRWHMPEPRFSYRTNDNNDNDNDGGGAGGGMYRVNYHNFFPPPHLFTA